LMFGCDQKNKSVSTSQCGGDICVRAKIWKRLVCNFAWRVHEEYGHAKRLKKPSFTLGLIVKHTGMNASIGLFPKIWLWFSFMDCVVWIQTMYQTTKFSASSVMPERSKSQAGEPWAPSPAGGPTYSAGSPGASGGGGAAGSAAKQRLRWTPELHERFVDAVTQLGGPDREFSLGNLFVEFVWLYWNPLFVCAQTMYIVHTLYQTLSTHTCPSWSSSKAVMLSS
jgi:hypothetical protein